MNTETMPTIPEMHDSDTLLGIIKGISENPDVDVEKVERLLSMYERMQAQARLVAIEQAFSEAFARAQADMKPIAVDSSNPQTKSRYASQAAIDIGIREIYTSHGFSLSFDTEPSTVPDTINLVGRLRHTQGYFKDYRLPMAVDTKGPKGTEMMTRTHATQSALTYGQRGLTKMIFNIAVSKDDDGNAAGKPVELITAQQLSGLIALCDALKVDKELFCQHLHVNSLAEIPARDYDHATDVLAMRQAQVAAADKAKKEAKAKKEQTT